MYHRSDVSIRLLNHYLRGFVSDTPQHQVEAVQMPETAAEAASDFKLLERGISATSDLNQEKLYPSTGLEIGCEEEISSEMDSVGIIQQVRRITDSLHSWKPLSP
jgi:hypothetical protein